MTTHIITAGGGGFSMSATGSPTSFDRYLVGLSNVEAPLVCFVPTASADDPTYINKFLVSYGALGVRTMVLTLWTGAAQSVERLPEADIVFVGGGSSTVNMMALWQAHGVDKVLRRMANSKKETIFAGISAGACCWFEGCLTDSFGPMRPWRGGLGLLKGSFCPHFQDEEGRAGAYTEAIASGILPDGYAIDDGAAIHWVDGKLHKVISEREDARVLHFMNSVQPGTSGVTTQPLDAELI